MQQLVPSRLSAQQYSDDYTALQSALGRQSPDVRWYATFSPYPWVLSEAEHQELEALGATLHRAVTALVPAWFTDPRIQRIVSLPEQVQQLLRPMSSRPYAVGSIRPDFLHDLDGTVRVSEINARFPLNGFLISHILNRTVGRLGYLEPELGPLPALDAIPQLLAECWPGDDPVGVVRGAEKGWDIRLLRDILGPHVRFVEPPDLDVASLWHRRPPGVSSHRWTDSRGPLGALLLELHQNEIRTLRPAVVETLQEGSHYLNDLRTIFIAHDKRLLAVLASDMVRDYVTESDARCLRRHVIPTFAWGRVGEHISRFGAQRVDWIIKPSAGGKGEGIVVGRHCTPVQWLAALRRARPDDVLQPYVEPRRFPILKLVDGEVRSVPMHVVGMLPVWNGRVLGPGILRGSTKDVVNVAGGATVLFPALLSRVALRC